MQEKKNTLSVVVTGDVTIDWNIAHHTKELREPTDWTGESSCSINWQYGSAALLADLVSTIAIQLNDKQDSSIVVTSPDLEVQEPVRPYDPNAIHSHAIWAPYYEKDPTKPGPGDPHWRIERFLGLDHPSKDGAELAPVRNISGSTAHADIIVIDDSNLGFRDQPDRWPQAIKSAKSGDDAPWIIVKMAPPRRKGSIMEPSCINLP